MSEEQKVRQVLQALSKVEDPDLKKDLVTLNMIQDVRVEDQSISFRLVLTTPACPLRETLKRDCEDVLKKTFGENTTIHIKFDAKVTTSEKLRQQLPHIKNMIGIASGKGGVGKSTITANIAVTLAQKGARVGILDADIFGPSMPILFAAQKERPQMVEKEGKKFLRPIEQYGVRVMSMGFLVDERQAVVWRGPMASTALKQLLNETDWGELDYLLIDLPPGTSDIPLTLAQTFPLTGVMLVSTPQRIAIADVRKAIAMFRQEQLRVSILGIVENMSYFSVSKDSTHKHYLFGQGAAQSLAKEEHLPFLGEIPIYEEIGQGGDHGYPASCTKGAAQDDFSTLTGTLTQQIAIQNSKQTSHHSPSPKTTT